MNKNLDKIEPVKNFSRITCYEISAELLAMKDCTTSFPSNSLRTGYTVKNVADIFFVSNFKTNNARLAV